MIELEIQFKIVIASIVYGMFITNLYTFIDIILGKSKVFKGVSELCFFSISSGCYYLLMYKINMGVLSVYMPVCLLFGWFLHMKYYDKYFSCLYEYIFLKIHCIISKKRKKWQKRWKELIRKKTKEAKSIEQFHT